MRFNHFAHTRPPRHSSIPTAQRHHRAFTANLITGADRKEANRHQHWVRRNSLGSKNHSMRLVGVRVRASVCGCVRARLRLHQCMGAGARAFGPHFGTCPYARFVAALAVSVVASTTSGMMMVQRPLASQLVREYEPVLTDTRHEHSHRGATMQNHPPVARAPATGTG